MARKKLTEYKAKSILFKYFDVPYKGIHVTPDNSKSVISKLASGKSYVFKVDQGIKKRFKRGLIGVDIKATEIAKYAKEFESKGFNSYLLEEFLPHKADAERYISFERTREGIKVFYSLQGGIDIESNKESIRELVVDSCDDPKIEIVAGDLDVPVAFIASMVDAIDGEHIAFLEINPLVVIGSEYYVLDLAVEVDSAADYFAEGWSTDDLIEENLSDKKTKAEIAVEKLAEKSIASFRLNVLNENGSIFMLLSGGGASIVLADEAYQKGFSDKIANYGEYSGNPNAEETYIYTKAVLDLLLDSNAKSKTIVIAGGVANFTDVYKTFSGLIKALDEYKDKLNHEGVKVFVRRGGPNEERGLATMEKFLKENDLYGKVTGSDYVLTDIVNDAIKYLKK